MITRSSLTMTQEKTDSTLNGRHLSLSHHAYIANVDPTQFPGSSEIESVDAWEREAAESGFTTIM